MADGERLILIAVNGATALGHPASAQSTPFTGGGPTALSRDGRLFAHLAEADAVRVVDPNTYEIVEVRSNKPIRYGTEPIVMSGTFAVLRHDPSGVIYRMSDAVLVAQK